MLSTALKLLRKSANYTGGAATGMALAAAAGGPAGALGLAGLLGLVALCVVPETGTEALEPDARLSRIELWLEELVRCHGRLDAAVAAIAEGRETSQMVSRKAAATLRSILSVPEDRVLALVKHDSDVGTLLGVVSTRLKHLDARTLAALERQAELLASIDGAVRKVDERVDGLHQKFDELRAQQDKGPSEEELEATAIDEVDNCRLRIEGDLLQLLWIDGLASHGCRGIAPITALHANEMGFQAVAGTISTRMLTRMTSRVRDGSADCATAGD